jgi:type II secretory pathway pseudopilin PulG
VVVLSAGSWFALRTVQLRGEVARLEAQRKQEQQAAQQTIAAANQQTSQIAQELERARATGGQSAPGLNFALSQGLTRGGDTVKRLVVPTGSGDVTLQLETKTSYKSYRAELQNLDGGVLWSQAVSRPSITIPSRVLAKGDYVVVLKGIAANGESIDAGEFYFQIVKQ